MTHVASPISLSSSSAASSWQNLPVPKEPVVFSKFASAITDPGANILLPKIVQELDFEVELAIVIGKDGKNITVRETKRKTRRGG